MTKTEALKLLKSGPKGVKEWSRWRRHTGGSHVDDDSPVRLPSLDQVSLKGADLAGVDLSRLSLAKADLSMANLARANLSGSNFDDATLFRSNLKGADLTRAHCHRTNFNAARLAGARLDGAYLWRCAMVGADLTKATLVGAELYQARLVHARMNGVDLRRALLEHAALSKARLRGAKLDGCRVYGASAWDLDLAGASQKDLVITPKGETPILVDNLKVAQFIYLLSHNPEIRDVIDTITSKVVLILGRFTESRKPVLDALREALREAGYSPVMFDFEKSPGRSYRETVALLAKMARFVVIDFTTPKVALQEVELIVPQLSSVPVQPLLQAQAKPPTTIAADYGSYSNFLSPIRYRGVADVRTGVVAKITEAVESHLATPKQWSWGNRDATPERPRKQQRRP